jgi:hypothetical protein
MARGRTQRTIQSEESQKMLMVDSGYPPMVKAQLRMLARGGKTSSTAMPGVSDAAWRNVLGGIHPGWCAVADTRR